VQVEGGKARGGVLPGTEREGKSIPANTKGRMGFRRGARKQGGGKGSVTKVRGGALEDRGPALKGKDGGARRTSKKKQRRTQARGKKTSNDPSLGSKKKAVRKKKVHVGSGGSTKPQNYPTIRTQGHERGGVKNPPMEGRTPMPERHL